MCNSRKRQGPPESSGSLDRSSAQYRRVSGVFRTVFLFGILAIRLIGTFDSRLERKLRESRLTISSFESVTADASKRQPFRLSALTQLMGLRQPYVTLVPSLFHPTTYCIISSGIVKAKIFQEKQGISTAVSMAGCQLGSQREPLRGWEGRVSPWCVGAVGPAGQHIRLTLNSGTGVGNGRDKAWRWGNVVPAPQY